MKQQRIELQIGYVLHSRAYRETSVLLEVFTKEHGRLSMIAKGVRQLKSRRRALLQPFTPLYFSWWRGHSELYLLTQVEPYGKSHLLLPQRLICGLYANELLLRLLPREDPHHEIFNDYADLLQALSQQNHEQIALRIFEKRLIQNLGYALSLQQEYLTQQPIRCESYYRLALHQGLIEISPDHPEAIHGASIIALNNESLATAHLKSAKLMMRIAIEALLGQQPLYCRSLFI